MKKLLLLMIMLSLLLAGCASQPQLDPEHPTTITIWHVYGNQTKSPLNDAIDEFNKSEGVKQGVRVKITSISNSKDIDKALITSANKAPGYAPLPNLFTAYPRIIYNLDQKLLLDWSRYFTLAELKIFQPDFLKEGYEGKALYMLPIAKSTDVLFVNQTLFQQFAKASGAQLEQLQDFDQLFRLCQEYYRWSGGKDMFQINDYYHYFHITMNSLGSSFLKEGHTNTKDPVFAQVFLPMARAAIAGGLCVEKGYASDRWATGAIISNVGSSAGVLYNRDYVIYPNNQRINVTNICLPYPTFLAAGGKPMFPHRGVGLFARQSDKEEENLAVAVLAKWLTQKEHNLYFATKIGYLPTNQQALRELLADPSHIKSSKHRQLFASQKLAADTYTYLFLPRGKNVSQVQFATEKLTRQILSNAHKEYQQRLAKGDAANALVEELAQRSLQKMQQALP